jgi:hypothetical protein
MTPVALGEALVRGAEVPEGVQATDWENARAVLAGAGDAASLPRDLALAILEAAVLGRSPGAAERLSGDARKDVAKAARRALYRLRSAGVAVSEPERAAAVSSSEGEPSPETLPAFITLPDGTGQRALLVAQPRRGAIELVEAMVSDELGILSLVRSELARGAWRTLLRGEDLKPFLSLTFAEATELLAQAARHNLDSRTPFPPEAEVVLGRLGVQPAAGEPPPLPAPEDGDAVLSVDSARLHGERELAAWLPPEPELRRLALKVDELRTSPLALTPEQQTQALRERIRAQVEAFFTEPRRRLYARRLWAVAEGLERRGATEPARMARATARRLFHATPETIPAFAEALFTKVLALMSRRPGAEGQSMEGATGAAAAGEPAPSSAAPGERRSPGGLILP